MIKDYMKSIVNRPEYLIVAYLIDEKKVVIFVSAITPEQRNIPKTMFGRDIRIVVGI